MDECNVRTRGDAAQPMRIRNVPIAVTPEGFWCCPSPAALQKTLKNQSAHAKAPRPPSSPPPPSKAPSVQRAPTISSEKRAHSSSVRARSSAPDQDPRPPSSAPDNLAGKPPAAERPPKPTAEIPKHKISVGFGQIESSDLKIVLHGKDGVAVKMAVHKTVLAEHSTYYADELLRRPSLSTVELEDCEDVEIYVETVGLMYCKDVKLRLIKQTVPRVLRILKVAESIGYQACVRSCLDYLEAVPWVGEEEESVVASVRQLQGDKYGGGVSPVLKRVSSDLTNRAPNDTLSHILELVLKSTEERGRRDMKTLVLKLLKENSHVWSCNSGSYSADICTSTLYDSCRSCLDTLLNLFREAAASESTSEMNRLEPVMRCIALEADNLLWLVEILADRNVADEFTVIWASQTELAALHRRLPVMSRHLVSCISARLFVGIGRGEMLPAKETRHRLLDVWLQPLMEDYGWLQHGCRSTSFDRKAVEEGIGRTILTLPLEDQQTMLLSWLGKFLKVGDSCPNLQRAFEVWWRRTFIRPYVEQQAICVTRVDGS